MPPTPSGEITIPAGVDPSFLALLTRSGLLKPLLQQQVIDECVADISIEEADVQVAQQRYAQQFQLRNGDDLERHRLELCLTPRDLQRRLFQPLQLERFAQARFGSQAQTRFLARKNQLDQVVYSLLRLQDAGLARELYLRLNEGEASFTELAASHGEGPEQATLGVVGPVPLAQGHPRLVDRLRSASPGALLEPFQVEQWWLLVRLESFHPATFDQAMADRMVQELLEEWIQVQVDQRLIPLRQQLTAAA